MRITPKMSFEGCNMADVKYNSLKGWENWI